MRSLSVSPTLPLSLPLLLSPAQRPAYLSVAQQLLDARHFAPLCEKTTYHSSIETPPAAAAAAMGQGLFAVLSCTAETDRSAVSWCGAAYALTNSNPLTLRPYIAQPTCTSLLHFLLPLLRSTSRSHIVQQYSTNFYNRKAPRPAPPRLAALPATQVCPGSSQCTEYMNFTIPRYLMAARICDHSIHTHQPCVQCSLDSQN